MTNRLENFTFKTTTPNRLKDFPSKTPSNRLEDFKAPGPAVSVLEAPSSIPGERVPQADIAEQQALEQRNELYKYMRDNPEAIRKIQRQNENKVIQDYFTGLPETRTPYEARERQSRSALALQSPDDNYWRKSYLAKAKRAQIKKLQDMGLIPDERREYEGFWDELGRNTVGGSLNVASGLVGTLASVSEGAVWDKDKLDQWAQKLHEKSAKPAYTAAKGGGWKGFVAASVGQAAPYMAAATASVLITGQPYAAFGIGFSVEGDNAYRDALKAGATEEQAQMNRLVVGTINGAIEQVQISQIFKFAKAGKGSVRAVSKLAQQKAMKRIARKGGKLTLDALQHSAREALEEALQETTSIAAEARINPEAWNNATERILRSAGGGGVVGLGFGTAGRIMSRGGPQIKESLMKEGVSEKVAQRATEMLESGRTVAEVDRNLVAPSRLLGDRVLDLDEKAIDQAQAKEKPTGAAEERWFEKDIFGARRILGIVGRLFSKGSEKTENDIVTEIKSKQPSLKEDEARQLARRHIASQIEYEKVIYDELLQRHFQGDKKATEDLNNLVQEFHLPTYEAYLKKINEASDYYAEYIQEGMLGRGPVKPKSIKSFIAPKEGVPTETAETPRPGIGGQAATRGVQVPDIAPERLSVPEGVRTPPGGEIEATESKYGGIPFPSEEPGRISLKEAFERKAGPTTKKTIPELQAEIDGYLRAQKNPPTELLAEFNAAVKAKKGKRVISEDSYKAAKKRLTDRNTLRMGIDPQGFIDLATIGAYHIESGLRTFGKWSQKMVEEFGDKIKPELKKIWKDSRQLAGKAAQGRKPKLAVGISEFMAEDVQPTIAKVKEAGKTLREIGLAAPKLFMKVIEPAKAAERMTGKVAASTTIRAIHRATDVAQWEWEAQRNETMDMNMEQLKKFFEQFSKKENRDFFVAYAGKPGSIEAEQIQREAKKRLPDILKQPRLVSAIREISEKNHKALKQVVGDNIGWVEDYFYGLYKNPSTVFAKWKKSTKRFTKHKVIPSLADVINMGSEALHDNYIDNLKAEYMGIARLGAMTWLKTELMRTGEGVYIDNMGDAPVDWSKVEDPVFKAYLVQPDLALLINNLISTNKVTQQPALNAARKVGNFLRITKFIGSIYHLRSEIQQAIADSGYLGFLHKKTALRGFQSLAARKKQWEKLRRSPEYKRLLENGIGYRYSYEQQAQKQFKDFVDKFNRGNFIGATIRGAKIPLKIPARFTGWLFDQMIPMTKTLKVMDAQMELEKKEGRPATDWEIQNIIKETQNFYGEMNERLFGRSGTVTTTMRFIYLAPGFAEGNYRTILKSLLQWGQGEGWRAGRSRSNMVNSPLITATIATLGTLMLTGKQPKKPENLEDVRDLFKIDTGKKDARGRKVMIDMMTYDKDYWNIYFNVLRGRPDVAAYESLRRLGGMKSPLYDMFLDFQMMSTGKAILDWKGDRVTEITDTSLEKLMKIAIHEIKKTEPIPMSVYKQSRRKEVGKIISFVQAVAGVRPTLTEKDKREGEILRRCWSLSHQKEDTYRDLATLHRPRGAVKWYNNKVKDVLESKLVPKSMKDEWIPKLTIDLEKYLQNKAMDASRLPTTKESKEQIEKAVKILKNFDISPNAAEQLLTDYYKRPKTKVPYSPIESDRILGRARKKKRLKERMQ